jgi:predicted GNAT family acetyltransferase
MDGQVVHDEQRSTYEYMVDGRALAVADYRLEGDRAVMHHTHTDPAYRGRGFAAIVVEAALDDLRARGLQVVPVCWYVAEFIDGHPEYADLVAAG